MKNNKIPNSIIKRPKQAYRAPISGSLLNDNSPEYFQEMLSESKINSTGLFNFNSVIRLLNKIESSQMPSEVDNMALTAILSSQILSDMFVNNNKPRIDESMLVNTKVIQE